jgi:hypothetical protein
VRTLAACLLALLAVAPTGAAEPSAAPSLATLLGRHTPVLVLHPAETFRPVSVDGFLADSDLLRRVPGGWEKVDGPLPTGGPDYRLDQRLCRARDGVAATSCYATAEAAHGAGAVVYGAAFRRGSRIVLEYGLWYPFNNYSPTVPPGELWQVHEGDWEAVSVVLDIRGRPLLAAYSQHSAGLRREWGRVPKQGSHPRVYVALGSHANYFRAGTHRFDPRIVSSLFISVIEQNGQQPVDHTGSGQIVRPRLVRITATSPSWMTFAGRWGEDEYVHVPGGSAVATGGAGPPGPGFHEQWRSPVRELLSWGSG